MTLTREEVQLIANSLVGAGAAHGVTGPISTVTAYLRLITNRPTLDDDDARAIIDARRIDNDICWF